MRGMEKTLRELAALVGGEVVGDGDAVIRRVAAIDRAGQGDITFVSNVKYEPQAATTRATAVIVPPRLRHVQRNLLVCDNPYLAFARVLEAMTEAPSFARIGVDPSACISPSARLGRDVSIWPRVHVGHEAAVGDRTILMPGVYVGRACRIGCDTVLHPNVVLYHGTVVGDRVILHANVSVGSDGFGFAPDGERYHKIPQAGITVIEDDVSVGANTTINRGALGNTIIRRGCKIDSQVIISHNVDVGENTIIVSQVGLSGTVRVGRHVTLAGQVGVAGHLEIGDNVMVAGQSGVNHSLAPDQVYLGSPARPIAEARKGLAVLARLPELRADVRALTARLEAIEKRLADT